MFAYHFWFLSVTEGPQGLGNPTFFLVRARGRVGFFLHDNLYIALITAFQLKILSPHTKKIFSILSPFFCKKMYVFANINYVDILQNIWRQNEKI